MGQLFKNKHYCAKAVGGSMRKEISRYFYKSKVYIFLGTAFFCAPYGFAIFFTSLGMTGFSLLHTIARYNFYLCFCLICLTYDYVSSANRNYVKEVSEAYGQRFVYERNAAGFIIAQTVFWNFGMCLLLVLCSFRNDGTDYFLAWFPANYVCNVLVPQLICVGITFFVSASWNSSRWVMAQILFLFLISPFAEDVVWTEKPSVPIDAVWKFFRRPFEILYQNGVWSPDVQNDLQLEGSRISVQIFWLLLLICVGTVAFEKNRRYTVLTGAAACLCLAWALQPGSVYRLNESWDGIRKDFTDYGIYVDSNAYQPMKDPAFEVKEYDLEVSFGRQLSVAGSMEVEAQEACEQFVFTLYHGYQVKELSSQTEGITVSFCQDKDRLLVKTSSQVKKITLNVSYQGYHQKFYSNSRAVMLPGWFPWYPMAGECQIVLEYPEYGDMWGYNPYNRIPEAHIRIRSDCALVTNLAEQGDKIYEGDADSITLLGGNLAETQDSVVMDYLPLELYASYGTEEFIVKQRQEYQEALRKLKQVYGVDCTELENKRIIFASKDMGRNQTNNFLAVFDQYFLAVPNYVTADSLLKYMALEDCENQKRREGSALIGIFLMSYFDDEPEQILQSWRETVQMQLQHPEYFDCTVESPELFLEILETSDSQELVKKAVHYMLHPEEYIDDQEFLESNSSAS